MQLEYNDELVREVAISLRRERFIDFYLDNPKACLKNFAEYGWDEESDRLAEEYVEKYVEEMKLHCDQRKRQALEAQENHWQKTPMRGEAAYRRMNLSSANHR